MKQKLLGLIFTSLLLLSCDINNSKDIYNDSNKSSNDDCIELTHNVEVDLKSINPENKDLKAEDLGVVGSYLEQRFSLADKNKDSTLNIEELTDYLKDLPKLAEICRKI